MIPGPEHFFTRILNQARETRASDIHLLAGLPPAFRVHGDMVMSALDPVTKDDLTALTQTLLTPAQAERFEKERELCVSHVHQEHGRLRLTLYHRLGVPEMAIRLGHLQVPTADELMLPKVVDRFAGLTSGLVLITGPTGVGKTTTLNYLVDLINVTRRCKVITIEDPVEYDHAHRKSMVIQIEVATDTSSFAACLRHILRLDPDVICIGEMRDLDTIETALAAAETGHLVIGTLHTPTGLGAVERIVSVFEGAKQPQVRLLLSENLQGVVAQRLLPTADKQRRVLAAEVIMVTPAIRNNIREGNFHHLYNALITTRSQGSQTLEEALVRLYRQGLITYDLALSQAPRPKEFEALLRT